ncbi:chromodomain-helicase-DNA-binding protein 1-like [Aplysia californica]|uniref:Chromodomain-helicase-DNA-binding protein 1-like n=1 Tax=Aplysia californica TaxID=6500 RepID=A0ABM0JP10_APLCA|nr:chromodomain-helicase-DNA-binding protein 1-like [Aplysia californica]
MAAQIDQETLQEKYEWSDLELRPYQLEGVNWMLGCHGDGHGCILGDEMGLGKTCQTIAMLSVIKGLENSSKPHLVVCPRTVLENWEQEFRRFSPSLEVLVYFGNKEERAKIALTMQRSQNRSKFGFDVLLTTYEICMKDYLTLMKIPWCVLVVDEGHRLKNVESLLYKTLEEWDVASRILLTGTPVQNNLRELYALLSFVDCSKFKPSRLDRFVEKYSRESQDVSELHLLMKPYFLRRTKSTVLADLPEKSNVVLYHGLSALQKKLYKAIHTKDIEVFESRVGGSQTRLMNILMQLRKCVNHPYLFDGVEPEPFEQGEHLVESSHKLVLIDRLLSSLHQEGHKVLLFSQMARMLDVLQDYLTFRGYTYERLDGSVRGEERFMAVQNFNEKDDTFVFLLSTRAGGQGLNLTSADTVIFVDSDFNPQNDLQAAARAHRIGQDRPVKVIRLIGRNTVEEIILRRAEEKLKLTEKVIEKGAFASASTSRQAFAQNGGQLQEILKFGVDELLTEAKADEPVDFAQILGRSKGGQWVVEKEDQDEKGMDEDEEENNGEKAEAGPSVQTMELDDDGEPAQSMYMFEGTDYSKEPTAADIKAFDELIQAEKEAVVAKATGERNLRRAGTSVGALIALPKRKQSKQLTAEELEEREKKRQEAAENRAKKAEEQARLRAEEKKKKRDALWKANDYVSVNIALEKDMEVDEEEEEQRIVLTLDADEDEDRESAGGTDAGDRRKRLALNYVIGDVTHPVDAQTDVNIIVHCTDDSGYWGHGGLFSALSARTSRPEMQYELAGKMKDLSVGDCHLVAVEDGVDSEDKGDYVALIVAQSRDKRTNKLSGIKLPALSEGLEKVYQVAKAKNASVHLPRIGHDTPGFNWYGTERLLRKQLASRGVPTYIYYFRRQHGQKRKNGTQAGQPSKVKRPDSDGDDDKMAGVSSPSSSSSPLTTSSLSTSAKESLKRGGTNEQLPAMFTGMTVHFHNVSEDKIKGLKRFVIAYDGDISSSVNEATTHLVTDTTDVEELIAVLGDATCCVLTPAWIEDCVSKGKLLPSHTYAVSLS